MIKFNKFKDDLNLLKKKNNLFFILLIFFIFALDRISKIKILSDFNNNSYIVNNFLNLDLTWNIGIGFGLMSTDSNLVYNLISTLIGLVLIVLFYIFLKSTIIEKFIYSLIIGGALGNFYDRMLYKAVPDFIDLHYNNFHWFVFNVADIFITLGIVILLVKSILKIE